MKDVAAHQWPNQCLTRLSRAMGAVWRNGTEVANITNISRWRTKTTSFFLVRQREHPDSVADEAAAWWTPSVPCWLSVLFLSIKRFQPLPAATAQVFPKKKPFSNGEHQNRDEAKLVSWTTSENGAELRDWESKYSVGGWRRRNGGRKGRWTSATLVGASRRRRLDAKVLVGRRTCVARPPKSAAPGPTPWTPKERRRRETPGPTPWTPRLRRRCGCGHGQRVSK